MIVTTPFAVETDVDDGMDGRVDVVDVVDVATGAMVNVVVGAVASVGWLELEHAVATATEAATSATKR